MSEETIRLGRERRFLVLLGIICLALIGGALYMQIVLGEAPCPLCILQRYALLLIATHLLAQRVLFLVTTATAATALGAACTSRTAQQLRQEFLQRFRVHTALLLTAFDALANHIAGIPHAGAAEVTEPAATTAYSINTHSDTPRN